MSSHGRGLLLLKSILEKSIPDDAAAGGGRTRRERASGTLIWGTSSACSVNWQHNFRQRLEETWAQHHLCRSEPGTTLQDTYRSQAYPRRPVKLPSQDRPWQASSRFPTSTSTSCQYPRAKHSSWVPLLAGFWKMAHIQVGTVHRQLPYRRSPKLDNRIGVAELIMPPKTPGPPPHWQ